LLGVVGCGYAFSGIYSGPLVPHALNALLEISRNIISFARIEISLLLFIYALLA